MNKKIIVIIFVMFQVSALEAVENDVLKGRDVFMQKCMGCHGEAGEGKLTGQPNFKEGDAFFKSESVLIDIIREGKGVMPSFNGLLSDEEIRNVVVYIKTFL